MKKITSTTLAILSCLVMLLIIYIHQEITISNLEKELVSMKSQLKLLDIKTSSLKLKDKKDNQYRGIKDVNYHVVKVTENGTIGRADVYFKAKNMEPLPEDVKLVYRVIHDSTQAINADLIGEWQHVDIIEDMGLYKATFPAAFACNYELKLTIDNEDFEELEPLLLYTSLSKNFGKVIRVLKLKENYIDFEVQVVDYPRGNYDTYVKEAKCHVIYDGKVLDSFDLKNGSLKGRKNYGYLESSGYQEMLYVRHKVNFDDILTLDRSRLSIVLEVKDSVHNIYRMIEQIEQ